MIAMSNAPTWFNCPLLPEVQTQRYRGLPNQIEYVCVTGSVHFMIPEAMREHSDTYGLARMMRSVCQQCRHPKKNLSFYGLMEVNDEWE